MLLNHALFMFNRGLVSALALARVDLKRLSLAAETFTNWIAKSLGPMMLRPGWKYLGSSRSDLAARHIQFIFSTDDQAILEITNTIMRVWVNDALITRTAVSTVVTNENFATDLASWTDNDEAGGTSVWVTGGYMGLAGNGSAAAIRRQTLTVSVGNQNVEHALRIVIERGPVTFRLGSTSVGDEYVRETSLDTGTHSLAFTPTGASVFVEFSSRLKRQILVDSCNIEGPGAMTVAVPWTQADLDYLRVDQSGDIVFAASGKSTDNIGYQQYKIERRATRSWSAVKYYADDGPFGFANAGPITFTPGALSGNTTLTASVAYFRSGHVGALFRVTSSGQRVTASVTAANQFTGAIRVTGTGTQRPFTVIRSGTWVATVTLQRSLESEIGPWTDVATYTTNGTVSFDDGLSNQIAWYRIGVKTGDFTSGTVVLELNYSGGSIDGVCRATGFTSATVVDVEVIKDFGATTATADWAEGEWSSVKGFPTSAVFHEGRLWFAGRNGVWGSGSDNFYQFNDEITGDAAPINRTIGSGPVDTVNWILSLSRLILGTEGSEVVCKSSSQDEPLTPSNFNPKATSTRGSGNVSGVKIDKRGIFVTRSGVRVQEISIEANDYEFGSGDMTVLVPEIGKPGIVRIAVQREPDTRVHFVRSDGKVALLIIDKVEEVLCWSVIETDGSIEDVVILNGALGSGEDAVHYSVKRTINGVVKRYLEKWALESNCVGGTLNHQADSYYQYSGIATTTIAGLDHLEAKSVVVWANGKDLGAKTVTGGQITGLSESVTSAIVGLTATSQWKSSKLGRATPEGTTLMLAKNVGHLGVILKDTHYQGLKYGRDFSNLDDLPQMKNGAAVAADTIYTDHEGESFEFDGSWDTDSRLCLQAQFPRPCTVLAVTMPLEVHAKT